MVGTSAIVSRRARHRASAARSVGKLRTTRGRRFGLDKLWAMALPRKHTPRAFFSRGVVND